MRRSTSSALTRRIAELGRQPTAGLLTATTRMGDVTSNHPLVPRVPLRELVIAGVLPSEDVGV